LIEEAHGRRCSRAGVGGPFEIGGVIPTEAGEWFEMAGRGGAYFGDL
jgi:hypothetical protein